MVGTRGTQTSDFSFGDDVQVEHGYGWDGRGKVERISPSFVTVRLIDGKIAGKVGGFYPDKLVKITSTVTPAPAKVQWTSPAPPAAKDHVVKFRYTDSGDLNWAVSGNKTLDGTDLPLGTTKFTKADAERHAKDQNDKSKRIGIEREYRAFPVNEPIPSPVVVEPKDHIVQFILGNKWTYSGNSTEGGIMLAGQDDKETLFTKADAEKHAAYQNKQIGSTGMYRAISVADAEAAKKAVATAASLVQKATTNQLGQQTNQLIRPVIAQSVKKLAKIYAVEIGRAQKTVTSDDVQARLKLRGYSAKQLGNAAGSLFSDKKLFRRTERTVKSVRPEANGRRISVWEYIGA